MNRWYLFLALTYLKIYKQDDLISNSTHANHLSLILHLQVIIKYFFQKVRKVFLIFIFKLLGHIQQFLPAGSCGV